MDTPGWPTDSVRSAGSVSIVLPALDEATSLETALSALAKQDEHGEVILVDDGSTDATTAMARRHGARVVRHPYNMGNGAAIKSGARAAGGDVLVFMDADGQHDPDDIPRLLERLDEGYDMVVGARSSSSQANTGRRLGNRIYNWLASYMTGHRIEDLTSGFRAVRADKFREFLHLLPNGFSYPTTITMAFFRAGYPVAYIPITAGHRTGNSHIKPLRDGLRFLLIIFKVGTLYSPLKIFAPASLALLLLGFGYYGYSFWTMGRFTNMSALLLMTGFTTFLIGLVSEQVTALMYQRRSSG